MRAKLSKRVIDEAEYQGPGGCYVWDTAMPGFGIRIYPSGQKAFVVAYSIRGRRRFFTIGRYRRRSGRTWLARIAPERSPPKR